MICANWPASRGIYARLSKEQAKFCLNSDVIIQCIQTDAGQLAGRGGPLTATALFGTTTGTQSLYDISVKDIDGKDLDLSKYKGKVLLVVNVASACGCVCISSQSIKADSSTR